MAAITSVTQAQVALPNIDIVTGTASDGETYTTNKMAVIDVAMANFMEDISPNTSNVHCAISTNTVTLHCDGVTDKKVAILLIGH